MERIILFNLGANGLLFFCSVNLLPISQKIINHIFHFITRRRTPHALHQQFIVIRFDVADVSNDREQNGFLIQIFDLCRTSHAPAGRKTR